MKRLPVLMIAAFVAAVTMSTRVQSRPQFSPRLVGFDVTEATIYDMQTAMQRGQVTSKELVLQSLARIAIYRTTLNPVISLYQGAIAEAEQRDIERANGTMRGPLHGIPIALKDNIHTTDHADDRRRAGVRRLHAAVRRDADDEPARRRRDHHREDGDDRARQLGRRNGDAGQLQRASGCGR